MQKPTIKVYGYFKPCAPGGLGPLRASLRLLGDQADAVLRLEGELLHISFEGVYFPIEDLLAALAPLLGDEGAGRIDYLDLEAWSMTRYALEKGRITRSVSGLNNVLAYSGH